MIERIIENWLISSTERIYQVPFAQILCLKGERVLHVSRHGVGEQGKDIISTRADKVIGYQLKTGDINTTQWRAIRGEIQDLTGC